MVPHINRITRRPPAWRDPQFPDVERSECSPGFGGDGYRRLSAMNELQESRGLPPFLGLPPFDGRPTMVLSWWDKRQKRDRSVTIFADIVMTPDQWNCLHPMARRLVPHRLLPPAILDSRSLEPI